MKSLEEIDALCRKCKDAEDEFERAAHETVAQLVYKLGKSKGDPDGYHRLSLEDCDARIYVTASTWEDENVVGCPGFIRTEGPNGDVTVTDEEAGIEWDFHDLEQGTMYNLVKWLYELKEEKEKNK